MEDITAFQGDENSGFDSVGHQEEHAEETQEQTSAEVPQPSNNEIDSPSQDTPNLSKEDDDVEKHGQEEEIESGSSYNLEGENISIERKEGVLEGKEADDSLEALKQDQPEQERDVGDRYGIEEEQIRAGVEEGGENVDADIGTQDVSPGYQEPVVNELELDPEQNVAEATVDEVKITDSEQTEQNSEEVYDGGGGVGAGSGELIPPQHQDETLGGEEDVRGKADQDDQEANDRNEMGGGRGELASEQNQDETLGGEEDVRGKADQDDQEANDRNEMGGGRGELASEQNQDETPVVEVGGNDSEGLDQDVQDDSNHNGMDGDSGELAFEQNQDKATVEEAQTNDLEEADPTDQGGDIGDEVDSDNEELAFEEILQDGLDNQQTISLGQQEGVEGDQEADGGGTIMEDLGQIDCQAKALETLAADDTQQEKHNGCDEGVTGGEVLDTRQGSEEDGNEVQEAHMLAPPEGDRDLDMEDGRDVEVVPEQDLGDEIKIVNRVSLVGSGDEREIPGDTEDFHTEDHENGSADKGPNLTSHQFSHYGNHEEEGGRANLNDSMKPLSKRESAVLQQTEEDSQDDGTQVDGKGKKEDDSQPHAVFEAESLDKINADTVEATDTGNTELIVQDANRQGATVVQATTSGVHPPAEDLNHNVEIGNGLSVDIDSFGDVHDGVDELDTIRSPMNQRGSAIEKKWSDQVTRGGNVLNASHSSFGHTKHFSDEVEQLGGDPENRRSTSIRDGSIHQTAFPQQNEASPLLRQRDQGPPGLTSQQSLLDGGAHNENDPLSSSLNHNQHAEHKSGRIPSTPLQPTVEGGIPQSKSPFLGDLSNGALNRIRSRKIGNQDLLAEHEIRSQGSPSTFFSGDVGTVPPPALDTPQAHSSPVQQVPAIKQFNPASYANGGDLSNVHKSQQDQATATSLEAHLLRPQQKQLTPTESNPGNMNCSERLATGVQSPMSTQDASGWTAGVARQQERAQSFNKEYHHHRPTAEANESGPQSQAANLDIASTCRDFRQRRTWETAHDGRKPVSCLSNYSTPTAVPEIGTHGYSPMVPGSPVNLCEDGLRVWDDDDPRAASPSVTPNLPLGHSDPKTQGFHKTPMRQVELNLPSDTKYHPGAFREPRGGNDYSANISRSAYNVEAFSNEGWQREPAAPSPSLWYSPPEPIDKLAPSGSHRRQIPGLPECVPPMPLPLPPSTERKTPSNIVSDRVTYRPPTRSYTITRPKTAQSIVVAAGSGTKAARERLKSAIMREAEVRMEAEMNAIDVEDLKLQKEIAEVTANEDAAVREDLEEQLQKAHTEIERLREDNAWRELDEERRQRHYLQDHVGSLRREIEILNKCLQQETDKRISAEKTLQGEREQWMTYIGNLSKTHQKNIGPEPPKPRTQFHSDDIRRDLRELQATVREANRNTQEILQTSRRTFPPPSSCGGGDHYLGEGTQGLPHHASWHHTARAPPSESHLGTRGTWGMSAIRTPYTLPHVSPQAAQTGVPRPWSPSARLHGVISDMHPPQNQSRGQQEWDTRPKLQHENIQLRDTNNFEVDVPHELHRPPTSWGGGHDAAGQSERKPAPEPLGFTPPKRGRKTFEFVEPVPPTKVSPSDLTKARMDYMQDVKRIRQRWNDMEDKRR